MTLSLPFPLFARHVGPHVQGESDQGLALQQQQQQQLQQKQQQQQQQE